MSLELNQHLGKQLRARRSALGLTQTQVARAINVTFQQIQKYEKVQYNPSAKHFILRTKQHSIMD